MNASASHSGQDADNKEHAQALYLLTIKLIFSLKLMHHNYHKVPS